MFEARETIAKPEFVVSLLWPCANIWEKNQRLHSRLHDTILNQYVAIETILEVNEMLLELEETTMNVVDGVNMKMLTQNMMRRRVINSFDEEGAVVE